MLYILYSDDYELFLGGNHLPEEAVMVETTRDLLAACAQCGIPLTLFCDVTALWRYRELGHTDFPDAVDAQMREAVKTGHDVQAHLHPHWESVAIDRAPDGSSRYDLALPGFLLGGAVTTDDACRDLAYHLLKRARTYLEDLLGPENPTYRCLAYRAGGYGIQPRTAAIATALKAAGYLIDSSVVPGLKLLSNVNRIDFRSFPRRGNYRLACAGEQVTAETGIFEIPVAASTGIRWPMTTYTLRRVGRRLTRGRGPHTQPRGYTIQSTETTGGWRLRVKQLAGLLQPIRSGWGMLELDSDAEMLFAVTRAYIDQFGLNDGDLFFAFSSHSKSITPRHLHALRSYHERLRRTYGARLEAITYQQAAERIMATAPAAVKEL